MTPLFDPYIMVVPRRSTLSVFCGMMTRSDFEPAITVPADVEAVGEFAGKTTPPFEPDMTALPEPLPEGSGGRKTGPDFGLLR